jgi:hypothetical protein
MRRTFLAMTRLEQDWAADVLTAFTLNGAPGLQAAPGEVDYLGALRRMRRNSTALAAFGLRIAVWMVAFAPVLLFGRWALFSRLARREQSELLTRLLVHKHMLVRELALLLKLTAAMALLGTASVRARSGYDDHAPRPRVEAGAHLHLPLAAAGSAARDEADERAAS